MGILGIQLATRYKYTHEFKLKVEAKKFILIPKKFFTISMLEKKISSIEPLSLYCISQLVVAPVKGVVANPTCLLPVSNTE